MALPEPPAADYVRLNVAHQHIRDYIISRRVIDAFMEPAEGLPEALPGAKRLRPGVEALLKRNINYLVRRADPEASDIIGSQYTYRFENEEGDDGAEHNKLAIWNNKYAFDIAEEDPDRPRENFIMVHTRQGVQTTLMDAVSDAFIRAVEATTRGVDAEEVRKQRNQEKKMVSEVAVKVGRNIGQTIPEGVLTKQVGKFLGGKRRKTKAKKARKSRRKTRRVL
jgi:hypothetical protein